MHILLYMQWSMIALGRRGCEVCYSTRTCKHNCTYACRFGALAVRIELSRARAGCRLTRIYSSVRAQVIKTRARTTNWHTHRARLRESDSVERCSTTPAGLDVEENKRKRSEKRLRLGRHSIHPTPTCGGVARSLFSVCVCAAPTLHRWRRVNIIIIMDSG